MRERLAFEREMAALLRPPQRELESQSPETCKARWEKLHDALPSDVQAALDPPGDPDFELAVALAVHHGLRDATKLTNMLFFTQYGQVHGYCKIQGDKRIPGGGDKYKDVWLELQRKFVRPMLSRPSPKLAQQGGIVCTKREVRLADPSSDNPGLDVTGRYEQSVKSGAPAFVLRINQAGNHIEALLRYIAVPGKADHKGAKLELFGDLQSDGSFYVFRRNHPETFGRLLRKGATGLDLTLNGSRNSLEQVSAAPTLLGPLDHLSGDDYLVRLHEQSPLSRAQTRHIVKSLAADEIEPFLVDYFKQASDDKGARRMSANKLDDYIRGVFEDDKVGVAETIQSDVRLARFYARTILTESKWKKGYTRSHLDWIQIMYSRVVKETASVSLPSISTWLGLSELADAGEHTYKVEMKLTGGGFMVHGYTGTITIEKTSPGKVWKKGEKHEFGCVLAGFEWGVGMKVADSYSGEATSAFEWAPVDIPGPIRLAEVGAGVSVGRAGLGASAGFLHIEGSGHLPILRVPFTDVGVTSAPAAGLKVGASIGPSGAWGRISSKKFPDIDYSTFHTKTDFAVSRDLTKDVHFCLDSALLTEDARQALRILCATELLAFTSPTSRLTIIGHTDRSASKKHNLTLSALRAANTLLAIKDILGDPFAIPRSRIHIIGQGEGKAALAGRKDDKVNAEDRHVQVILNARLVLTLRAA